MNWSESIVNQCLGKGKSFVWKDQPIALHHLMQTSLWGPSQSLVQSWAGKSESLSGVGPVQSACGAAEGDAFEEPLQMRLWHKRYAANSFSLCIRQMMTEAGGEEGSFVSGNFPRTGLQHPTRMQWILESIFHMLSFVTQLTSPSKTSLNSCP